MSFERVIANIDRRIKFLESGIPLERGVRSVMALQVERIFEQGKNAAGQDMGTYDSKNELYVNPSTLPKKITPRGKPGVERNVDSRKTVYFKSYKALREEMGRESGHINLRLTNDLQSDFANAQIKDGLVQNPEPQRVSKHEYKITLKREVNIQKKRGLEKRFGPIFSLTDHEKRVFFDVVEKESQLGA